MNKVSYNPNPKVKTRPQSSYSPFVDRHSYTPSIKITLHKKSAILSYNGTHVNPDKSISTRGVIKESSKRSENRFRIVWENNLHIVRYWILLTYPKDFPLDGVICKKHLKEMLRRLKRIGVKEYIVRLEFQKRGAVHWNILIPQDVDKAWLSRNWYEIVNSGDPNHLLAGSGIQKVKDQSELLSYLTTYLKKDSQKKVPENFSNVGRFWGCNSKAVPVAEYTLYFDSERERDRFARPFKKAYQKGILRHWKRSDGKPYKKRFGKNQGFTAWSGSRLFDKIISNMEARK